MWTVEVQYGTDRADAALVVRTADISFARRQAQRAYLRVAPLPVVIRDTRGLIVVVYAPYTPITGRPA